MSDEESMMEEDEEFVEEEEEEESSCIGDSLALTTNIKAYNYVNTTRLLYVLLVAVVLGCAVATFFFAWEAYEKVESLEEETLAKTGLTMALVARELAPSSVASTDMATTLSSTHVDAEFMITNTLRVGDGATIASPVSLLPQRWLCPRTLSNATTGAHDVLASVVDDQHYNMEGTANCYSSTGADSPFVEAIEGMPVVKRHDDYRAILATTAIQKRHGTTETWAFKLHAGVLRDGSWLLESVKWSVAAVLLCLLLLWVFLELFLLRLMDRQHTGLGNRGTISIIAGCVTLLSFIAIACVWGVMSSHLSNHRSKLFTKAQEVELAVLDNAIHASRADVTTFLSRLRQEVNIHRDYIAYRSNTNGSVAHPLLLPRRMVPCSERPASNNSCEDATEVAANMPATNAAVQLAKNDAFKERIGFDGTNQWVATAYGLESEAVLVTMRDYDADSVRYEDMLSMWMRNSAGVLLLAALLPLAISAILVNRIADDHTWSHRLPMATLADSAVLLDIRPWNTKPFLYAVIFLLTVVVTGVNVAIGIGAVHEYGHSAYKPIAESQSRLAEAFVESYRNGHTTFHSMSQLANTLKSALPATSELILGTCANECNNLTLHGFPRFNVMCGNDCSYIGPSVLHAMSHLSGVLTEDNYAGMDVTSKYLRFHNTIVVISRMTESLESPEASFKIGLYSFAICLAGIALIFGISELLIYLTSAGFPSLSPGFFTFRILLLVVLTLLPAVLPFCGVAVTSVELKRVAAKEELNCVQTLRDLVGAVVHETAESASTVSEADSFIAHEITDVNNFLLGHGLEVIVSRYDPLGPFGATFLAGGPNCVADVCRYFGVDVALLGDKELIMGDYIERPSAVALGNYRGHGGSYGIVVIKTLHEEETKAVLDHVVSVGGISFLLLLPLCLMIAMFFVSRFDALLWRLENTKEALPFLGESETMHRLRPIHVPRSMKHVHINIICVLALVVLCHCAITLLTIQEDQKVVLGLAKWSHAESVISDTRASISAAFTAASRAILTADSTFIDAMNANFSTANALLQELVASGQLHSSPVETVREAAALFSGNVTELLATRQRLPPQPYFRSIAEQYSLSGLRAERERLVARGWRLKSLVNTTTNFDVLQVVFDVISLVERYEIGEIIFLITGVNNIEASYAYPLTNTTAAALEMPAIQALPEVVAVIRDINNLIASTPTATVYAIRDIMTGSNETLEGVFHDYTQLLGFYEERISTILSNIHRSIDSFVHLKTEEELHSWKRIEASTTALGLVALFCGVGALFFVPVSILQSTGVTSVARRASLLIIASVVVSSGVLLAVHFAGQAGVTTIDTTRKVFLENTNDDAKASTIQRTMYEIESATEAYLMSGHDQSLVTAVKQIAEAGQVVLQLNISSTFAHQNRLQNLRDTLLEINATLVEEQHLRDVVKAGHSVHMEDIVSLASNFVSTGNSVNWDEFIAPLQTYAQNNDPVPTYGTRLDLWRRLAEVRGLSLEMELDFWRFAFLGDTFYRDRVFQTRTTILDKLDFIRAAVVSNDVVNEVLRLQAIFKAWDTVYEISSTLQLRQQLDDPARHTEYDLVEHFLADQEHANLFEFAVEDAKDMRVKTDDRTFEEDVKKVTDWCQWLGISTCWVCTALMCFVGWYYAVL